MAAQSEVAALSLLRLHPALADEVEGGRDVGLRVGVHDVTRMEWISSIDLPQRDERKYSIDVTIEIPWNLYSGHNPWDHLETYTRLKSPSEDGPLQLALDDVDELRRDTLGIAHRLKQLRQRVERTCLQAGSLLPMPAGTLGQDELICDLVHQAVSVVDDLRRYLDTERARMSPEVVREAALAGEFLSFQLLDFLSSAQRAIDELAQPLRLVPEEPAPDDAWIEPVRERLATAMETGFQHRRSGGMLNPRADSPTELSRFVERGSRLKKHFQNVLFLDTELRQVESKMRNWTATVAAALAAGFWLAFTLLPIGQKARAGVGLSTFGAVFVIAYALKDRVKELTRGWLAGRLLDVYGQRLQTLRLPRRIDPRGPVLVSARERLDTRIEDGDDVLNHSVGRTRRTVVLHYRMNAVAHASGALRDRGLRSIKHIFRYDVSPILCRLDNAVKRVPVLDEHSRRVRFADAPREYQIGLRLRASASGAHSDWNGQVVLSKRGIERIEAQRAGEFDEG